MNQYERIVSYIYQYRGEEKGANVGYAKVEKRGKQCRISVQMRAVSMREVPKVYFYKQMRERIQTIPAGQMVFRGNSFLWKESCDADKLFGSDWSLEEVDGIFIDGADVVYFATAWKNDHFYRGNWNENTTTVEEMNAKEKDEEPLKEEAVVEARDAGEEKKVEEMAMADKVSEQKDEPEPVGAAEGGPSRKITSQTDYWQKMPGKRNFWTVRSRQRFYRRRSRMAIWRRRICRCSQSAVSARLRENRLTMERKY